MRRVLIVLGFVACAHQPPPATSSDPKSCADFTGQYRFEARSCGPFEREVPLDTALWPDLSVLPQNDAIVGIHQEGCESVGIAVRGEDASDTWARRALTAAARADGAALTGQVPGDSTAPRAVYTWRLERHGNRVRYSMQFSERSFFLFLPLMTTRSVSCWMTPF